MNDEWLGLYIMFRKENNSPKAGFKRVFQGNRRRSRLRRRCTDSVEEDLEALGIVIKLQGHDTM